MHLVKIFVSLAFVACSASSSRPPQVSSSKPFDPFSETIEVSGESCQQLEGWYCVTPRGWKEMIAADIEQEKEYKASLAKANTSTRIAEEERKSAMEALSRAQWWSTWGPAMMAGAGFIGLAVGLGCGIAIGH